MKAKIIQLNCDDIEVDHWVVEADTEQGLCDAVHKIIKAPESEAGPSFFDMGDSIEVHSISGEHREDSYFYSCSNCRTIEDTGENIPTRCSGCGEKVTSQRN